MSRIILGKIYVGDNENVVFVVDNEENISEIYLMNDECEKRLLLSDRNSNKKLNFNEHHQITGIYRLRRGCEKTIYFTDNYNPPRYLNISDVNSFKEISQTNPFILYGDVDPDKMLLQKVYDVIPKISANIGNGGQLLSGSYNVSIRYVDEDMNPSEWIYTTEPIMIWQSNSNKFSEVRASTNDDKEYRKFGPTNKSIRVSVRNRECDHSYMFIQFALIGANGGTGFVNDVVYSPLIELDFNKSANLYEDTILVYNFTGGSDVMTGNEEEILANTEVFDKVKCIEMADDRLVMGNITDMDVDWCKLQKYASRITSDCVLKEIDSTDYENDENHKNPMVMFNHGVGYQPGEIYSFGIVYVFENGVKSPVYHIPGRPITSNPSATYNTLQTCIPMQEGNNMCSNAKYSDVELSCEGFKFWGYDCNGDQLEGQYIRHHRFPFRPRFSSPDETSKKETRYIAHYNLIVGVVRGHNIRSRFRNNFNTIFVKYNINTYSNSPYHPIESQEEFELEFPYDSKFWNSIYSDLDISLKYGDLITFYKYNSGNPAFFNGIGSDENDDEALVFGDEDILNTSQIGHGNAVISNNLCSNPLFSDRDCYSINGLKLKRNKQHRFLDVFSLDITDGKYATFQNLQEYPQFRENNSDISSRPAFMTTGSVIVYERYGGLTNEQRTIVSDSMEALESSFFENQVKVLPKNTGHNINRLSLLKNGRRVRLSFNGIIDENNDLMYKGETCLINTSIGFYVEPRVEVVQEVETKTTNTIMGIVFDNIDIPDDKFLNGHKVIGYYIVQNERTDEDVTIIDSAILTPLFKENDDTSSLPNKSVVAGKIFTDDGFQQGLNYTDKDIITNIANIYQNSQYIPYKINIGQYNYSQGNSSLLTQNRLYDKGVGIIYPQFKFNKKEYYDFKFKLLGHYYLKNGYTRYSSDYNEMWVTQDVQAGSSYNKKINAARDKDNDGFDLHVYHKNCLVGYLEDGDGSEFTFSKDDVHYLIPSSSILKQLGVNNNEDKSVFNASGDNTMGFIFRMMKNDVEFDTREFFFNNMNQRMKIDRLPYGYMVRELEDYYPNFKDRPYYIVSDLIRFDEKYKSDKRIFNGDCFISAMKYTNCIQYDVRMKKRGKKQTWWQYVVGIGGAVAATVGAVYTKGITASFIGPSLSMLENGIRIDVAFNTMKKFKDMDGKKSLTDGWVKTFVDTEQIDDEIQWLCESIDGLWFESRLNMNWRVGVNLPEHPDYLNPLSGYNPSELRQYFLKKFTYADKDHDDGRMYYGFAQAEVYDINMDFQRRNHQKMFYCIPITHKCCSECENRFPKRLVYSQQSFSEERTDNFKVFLPGNYKDIQGECGDVTNISYQGQDAFMVFAEEGLYQLPPTRQQKSNPVTQVVSFIGTGDFFDKEAQILLKNDAKISFGTKHQNSFCNTPNGLFWYSEHDNAIYGFSKDFPVDITERFGVKTWFEKNGRLNSDSEWYKKYHTEYPFKDNPSGTYGTGYVLGWDNKYKRLLITKKDNELTFDDSSCGYDAMQQSKQIAIERAMEIVDDGGINVCYHWSKEYCSWIIDYDSVEDDEIETESYSDGSVIELQATKTIIYIDPDNIEYFKDEKLKEKCGITKIIVSNLKNIYSDVLFVTSLEIYNMFLKYYDSTPGFYDLALYADINSIKDFVLKDWPSYLSYSGDNINYVVFTSNVENVLPQDVHDIQKEVTILSNNHKNFSIHVYPILQKEYGVFEYATLDDYLLSFTPVINYGDYDASFITDEYLYVTEKIDLTDGICPNYKNNSDEYKELLNELKNDILSQIEYINNNEFDISKFNVLVSLMINVNTYNHWNLIANSYDFVNYDLFGNGTKNLIMFKDLSPEFNAAALTALGYDWCDSKADYNALNKMIQSSIYTFMPYIEGFEPINVINKIKSMFDVLHDKYVKMTKSNMYQSTNTGNNLNTMVNLYTLFTPNKSSLLLPSKIDAFSDDDFESLLNTVGVKLLYGDKINNPVFIHSHLYINDFLNNESIVNLNGGNIYYETTFKNETTPQILKTYTINQNVINIKKYHENREFIGLVPEPESRIESETDDSFTISFIPETGFVSFHSYMPYIYVYTPNNIYSCRKSLSNKLFKHNVKGDYLGFYGKKYPFVIEMVDIDKNSIYGPQITDSISVMTEAARYNALNDDFENIKNVFFNKAYFYNTRQATYFSDILKKDAITDATYFNDYMNINDKTIPAEKREKFWHINKFNDFICNIDVPIHSYKKIDRNTWMTNKGINGWIDKALCDEDVLSAQSSVANIFCNDNNPKDWWELEPFRDTFICERFFYLPYDTDIRFEVILGTSAKTQSFDNTLK